MDDSEKPTIETEGLDSLENEWKMPEPVFRSTPGRDLRAGGRDPEKDIPTEPANKTEQSVRVKETPTQRHKKKKRGCAKFFTLLAVLIGFIIGSLVLALVYFLFYYRPSSTIF